MNNTHTFLKDTEIKTEISFQNNGTNTVFTPKQESIDSC